MYQPKITYFVQEALDNDNQSYDQSMNAKEEIIKLNRNDAQWVDFEILFLKCELNKFTYLSHISRNQ